MCSLGEIASAFAGIAGVEAVAWCGSTAMQKADFFSDYDLYVYWRTSVPLDARKRIIASRASEYQLDNTFWELEDEWIEPDGLRFNVMYRSCRKAEEEVHRRLVPGRARIWRTPKNAGRSAAPDSRTLSPWPPGSNCANESAGPWRRYAILLSRASQSGDRPSGS